MKAGSGTQTRYSIRCSPLICQTPEPLFLFLPILTVIDHDFTAGLNIPERKKIQTDEFRIRVRVVIQEPEFISSFDARLFAILIGHPEYMDAILVRLYSSKGSDIGTGPKATHGIDPSTVDRACLDFDAFVLADHDLNSAAT